LVPTQPTSYQPLGYNPYYQGTATSVGDPWSQTITIISTGATTPTYASHQQIIFGRRYVEDRRARKTRDAIAKLKLAMQRAVREASAKMARARRPQLAVQHPPNLPTDHAPRDQPWFVHRQRCAHRRGTA
jgi:hypothetical protein